LGWLVFITGFALLHFLHLRADFPNHTIWSSDWAKYTDEGWYANAAVRAHLCGNWYFPGDFNPAVAVPVWPFLEWILFFFTGVSIEAARGLAVAVFLVNLLLAYLLIRTSGPRWMALLAITFLVTSPFLYCFSRLAILEPLLTMLMLAALNLGVRLPRLRRPVWGALLIGILFTLMMLAKTYALFLLPAVAWAIALPLRTRRRLAIECLLAAGAVFAAGYGLWLILIVRVGLLPDYKLFFAINNYPRPHEAYWPLVAFWWSFHGALWADPVLIPLAGVVIAGALGAVLAARRVPHPQVAAGLRAFGQRLLLDPVFGASVIACGGTILFMTCQNHPQPRYFTLTALFCFFIVALGAAALLEQVRQSTGALRSALASAFLMTVSVSLLAAAANGAQTLTYAANPEYTFVDEANRLVRYIDAHPNGRRQLLSASGDQIMLATGMPGLCDDFGVLPLAQKIAAYRPGWFASWNDLDAGTLASLHTLYSLEQVATFPAFDVPGRNRIVLFKLHPLPGGQVRDARQQKLDIKLPGDKFDVEVD
jgi:4-amino-4-deoxy-L-arabinose transferase-like glycosyltransferase